jgi:multidrug efflux pump subunit AcrA (membrane-fusion protein)
VSKGGKQKQAARAAQSKAAKQKQAERAAQRKAERERKQRRQRLRRYGIIALIVAILGGALAAAVIADRREASQIEGLQSFNDLGRDHTEDPVEYEQTPPVGGDHSATPMTCGVYSEPIPDENAVHSLEHGAVWITYQPDLPETEVQALESFVQSQSPADQDYLLLSPYEDLSGPVVASAWGRQVALVGASDPRLAEFTSRFIRGSQAPEAGSPCEGVTMDE